MAAESDSQPQAESVRLAGEFVPTAEMATAHAKLLQRRDDDGTVVSLEFRAELVRVEQCISALDNEAYLEGFAVGCGVEALVDLLRSLELPRDNRVAEMCVRIIAALFKPALPDDYVTDATRKCRQLLVGAKASLALAPLVEDAALLDAARKAARTMADELDLMEAETADASSDSSCDWAQLADDVETNDPELAAALRDGTWEHHVMTVSFLRQAKML